MSVSYRELTGLNPRAFYDAGNDMSKAVSRLAIEHSQYRSLVLRPLQHKHGWRGGGQPDAAVVAKVNGLAVDTMRLRAAAGALAFMYAYAGFTLAQQQLSALCRQVENDDMKVDDDGNVSTTYVPVGDDNGLGSVSAKVLRYQNDIGKVLDFATVIDDVTAAALNGSHEPPVTGLTNRPGLLDEARKDHSDAENDAAGMLHEFQTLPGTAAQHLPADNGDMPDLPGVNIQVPPGQAGNTFGMGLAIMGLFLGGGAIGAGMGGQLEIAIPAGLIGAVCLAIGGALVKADGGSLPKYSLDGNGMPVDNPAADASLDKLMQQAGRLENEAKPGYQASQHSHVDPKKYDYMFGRANSSEHNAARSGQIRRQLARIGVHDNPEGRELLREHFDAATNSDGNVVKTYTDRHGTFQVRDSLLAGPGGFLHLETTWQVTNDGLRLTTVIPYGGP